MLILLEKEINTTVILILKLKIPGLKIQSDYIPNLSIDRIHWGAMSVDGFIDAKVGVIELNMRDKSRRNNRFVLQHLWTEQDGKIG